MLRKSRRLGSIWWGIIFVIIVGGALGWWNYTKAPEQVARNTLRVGVLSKDIQEKKAAIEALGTLREKKFVPLLKDASRDKNPEVRAAAVRALGEIRDSSALSILKESLFDKSWKVRVEAAHALVQLGDTSGIESLREALRLRD